MTAVSPLASMPDPVLVDESIPPTVCPECGSARAWDADFAQPEDAETGAWCEPCAILTFPSEDASVIAPVPADDPGPLDPADPDACDRCGRTDLRVHVGHTETHGHDGLCSPCLDDPATPGTRVSFYVSEDYPAGGTWSVYREWYRHADDDDPIDGSQRLVRAGLPSQARADALAAFLFAGARRG